MKDSKKIMIWSVEILICAIFFMAFDLEVKITGIVVILFVFIMLNEHFLYGLLGLKDKDHK
ncbi:Uncharacterised protein [Erysipelothrix amsterdamensis]|uniref:Uncharacterized protein n=1 Tax=Erysipelothrix amsterdamensis TaxID=2929157 RepID=A0AAU9VIY1_9FIRM|nr:Uncharacterised protein [Erysipelothrix sp. A18Y020d]CAH2763438.1 Uncharacterised protein [Erysipelothrix sp. A18Y020d]